MSYVKFTHNFGPIYKMFLLHNYSGSSLGEDTVPPHFNWDEYLKGVPESLYILGVNNVNVKIYFPAIFYLSFEYKSLIYRATDAGRNRC